MAHREREAWRHGARRRAARLRTALRNGALLKGTLLKGALLTGTRLRSALLTAALLTAAGLLSLPGCSERGPASTRPLLAVSIHPLGSLAREIAGEQADVVVLLTPGASPHHFEPTPRAVSDGSRASMVLRVGLGLDEWTDPLVREAVTRGAPEILASAFIDSLIPAQEHDMDHGLADPHVWLDPVAMIPVCREIGATLARLDGAHAADYERRAAGCIDSLRALDLQLSAILRPVAGVPFIATHNAWAYLSRRYGLRQAEVLQEVATHEPGPKRMVEILREAAEVGARAVFTEAQVSDASAQTLAREMGLTVAMLDPQGTPEDRDRDRYFDLLRWNARRIATALTAPAGTALPPPGGIRS